MDEQLCQCEAAGFCERYQKRQSVHHVQICKNEVLTPEKCEVYRENWRKLASGEIQLSTKEKPYRPPSSGPGTELENLIKSLGITAFTGCSCNKIARQMDSWGVLGCREHFQEIRKHLTEAQAKTSWFNLIRAAGNALISGLPIDPLDVAGSLIRIAIERADKGSSSQSSQTPSTPQ